MKEPKIRDEEIVDYLQRTEQRLREGIAHLLKPSVGDLPDVVVSE